MLFTIGFKAFKSLSVFRVNVTTLKRLKCYSLNVILVFIKFFSSVSNVAKPEKRNFIIIHIYLSFVSRHKLCV